MFKASLAMLRKQLEALARVQERTQEQMDLQRRQLLELRRRIGLEETAGEAPEASLFAPLADEVDTTPAEPQAPSPPRPRRTANLERWIGRHLLALIGIGILVFGVGIGVRWAIENDFIGPVARIVMGYATGVTLLGFAERLRSKYAQLSAILLGGGMSVLYGVTYAAHDLYGLIPLPLAFGLMVLFTAFTVLAALRYNLQVIAHLGLIGAYAVPILLGRGEPNWIVWLSYITILNTGILVVSYLRRWRPLVYVALLLSWGVYASLVVSNFEGALGRGLSLGFATVNFLLFVAATVAYKFRVDEGLKRGEVITLVLNALAYFLVGYAFLDTVGTEYLLGAFAVANALLYLALGVLLRQRGADAQVVSTLAALAIVLVAVAILVQLDGPWLMATWAAFGALAMFLAGRLGLRILRFGSYALYALSLAGLFFSITNRGYELPPFWNAYFFVEVFVAAAYGLGAWFAYRSMPWRTGRWPVWLLAVTGFCFLYLGGAQEISVYFHAAVPWDFDRTTDEVRTNYDRARNYYRYVSRVWQTYYLMGLALLAWLSLELLIRKRKLSRRRKNWMVRALLAYAASSFLVQALYALSEVRDLALVHRDAAPVLSHGVGIGLRYLGIALFSLCAYLLHRRLRFAELVGHRRNFFELLWHVVILVLLSSELIQWLTLAGSSAQYKLGLSILWGSYALLLIGLGLLWRRKHLRVAAMVLFGATLVKLFVYDLASLTTIAKTIVLVILGILLLVMSFLYTKFRGRTEAAESDIPEDPLP